MWIYVKVVKAAHHMQIAHTCEIVHYYCTVYGQFIWFSDLSIRHKFMYNCHGNPKILYTSCKTCPKSPET